ncbi:hypothetical protein MKW92_024716 [Papaver armeniacum]|nr:hypothetical protein MKW92_024716 [Papaver armeniacum]
MVQLMINIKQDFNCPPYPASINQQHMSRYFDEMLKLAKHPSTGTCPSIEEADSVLLDSRQSYGMDN